MWNTLAAIALSLTLLLPAQAQPRTPPCAEDVSSLYWLPMSTMRSLVGAKMGDPMQCGRDDPDHPGDILQTRTTGLVRYRPRAGLLVFDDFTQRWAATARGLEHWTTSSETPPPDAELLYVWGDGWPCEDGWISHAQNRQGACSSHGGFARDDLAP